MSDLFGASERPAWNSKGTKQQSPAPVKSANSQAFDLTPGTRSVPIRIRWKGALATLEPLLIQPRLDGQLNLVGIASTFVFKETTIALII